MTCGRCGHEENQIDFNLEVHTKLCEDCNRRWQERKLAFASHFMQTLETGQSKPSELALKIAKAITDEYSVGIGSSFCDESDFDPATDEEVAQIIDRVMKAEGR